VFPVIAAMCLAFHALYRGTVFLPSPCGHEDSISRASVKLPISHFLVWQVLPPLILWGD
jgi:hypothetical protein